MILAQQPSSTNGSSKLITPGEFSLSQDDFNRIAEILKSDAGIQLPISKASLVYSRLAKRLRCLGVSSFKEYIGIVEGAAGAVERQHLVAAMTTNVTRFFREPHHFEHMKQQLLPALVQLAKRRGRVRIWSTASSTGQEPYSIAMSILSVLPEAASLDVKILATDIDANVIETGRQAVYSEAAMVGLPSGLRSKFFRSAPSDREAMWKCSDELRALVVFRQLNLHGSWPMKGSFQAIFCRNVVIYFDTPSQQAIWSRFASHLSPEGFLYIGHSERVTGPAASLFQTDAITTYKLIYRGQT